MLALAASFYAQGLLVNPINVQVFDLWYLDLGISANVPGTRRLQQVS